MKNKTKSLLFKLPGILLLIGSVIGAFYVKISEALPLKWATPITLLVFLVLYIIGEYIGLKEESAFANFS